MNLRVQTVRARGRDLAIVVVWCAVGLWSAVSAQEDPAPASPSTALDEMMLAVAEGRFGDADALLPTLQGRDGDVVPLIEARLAQATEDQRVYLGAVLGGIGGDASTSLLLEMVVIDPASAPGIVGRLENRPVRRPLTPYELRALTDLIDRSSALGAGAASRVLANCWEVPVIDRVAPIADRLARELAAPNRYLPVYGSYLSPEAHTLNQFVLALETIGEPAIPALRAARPASVGADCAAQWWSIALGLVGDTTQAGALRAIAEGGADRYVRWVAIRAYARSAGPEAVPLLERLLADDTRSEYDEGYPLIQAAARAALWRLRNE